MSITVKLELNGRKSGCPKHHKQEGLLCRKNRGFRLPPFIGEAPMNLIRRHRFAATSSSPYSRSRRPPRPEERPVPRSGGGSAPCGMTLNSRPLGDNMLHRDDRALRHEPYERVAARLIPSRWPFAMRRAQHGPCRAKIGLFRRFQLLDLMDDHSRWDRESSGQRVFVATGTPAATSVR